MYDRKSQLAEITVKSGVGLCVNVASVKFIYLLFLFLPITDVFLVILSFLKYCMFMDATEYPITWYTRINMVSLLIFLMSWQIRWLMSGTTLKSFHYLFLLFPLKFTIFLSLLSSCFFYLLAPLLIQLDLFQLCIICAFQQAECMLH